MTEPKCFEVGAGWCCSGQIYLHSDHMAFLQDEADLLGSYVETVWRHGVPGKVLFGSNGTESRVIDAIGHDVEFEHAHGTLELHLEGTLAGVWIFEGRVRYTECQWTGELDSELVGATRLLSVQEWDDFISESEFFDRDEHVLVEGGYIFAPGAAGECWDSLLECRGDQ